MSQVRVAGFGVSLDGFSAGIQGEAPFPGIDLRALGFSVAEHEATEHATHVVLTRR